MHRSPYGGCLLIGEVIERSNSVLHLDRHSDSTVPDNEVYLAATDSYVASENRTAAPGEEAGGDLLANLS